MQNIDYQYNIITFNVFFNGLNKMHLNPSMEIYHEYYIKLVNETKLKPNIITFNTLLKAVRLSNPSRYKFVRYFLDEMDKYKVEYDSLTINEILSLIAKHPENPNNIQAANNWFNYFLDNICCKEATQKTEIVFTSYMFIFAKLDNKQMVQYVEALCRERGIWSNQLQRTYDNAMKFPKPLTSRQQKKRDKSFKRWEMKFDSWLLTG